MPRFHPHILRGPARLLLAAALALLACAGLVRPVAAAIEPIERIVAVVNDDVVLESELRNRLRTVVAQLRARATRLPPEPVLRRQVLERLIIERLQLQLAERLGIRVDDETLNRAIRDIARRNGMDLETFRAALERDGFSFERFREDIRSEMIIARLQRQQVASRVTVSDREVEEFLASAQAQARRAYRVAHILIAVPEAASPEQIAAARREAEAVAARARAGEDFAALAVAHSDGQKALEGGDLGWRRADELPSVFSDVVPRMKPGEVSEVIRSPSGFHIVKLLEVRGDEPQAVEQLRLRQILLRPGELLSEDEARLRLERLRERVLAGEPFETLARAHSDDAASAARGGDMGWLSPSELPPEVAEAVRGLSPGEVSRPFRTPAGWHLVQLVERRRSDDTEAYRRARARRLLQQRKVEERLQLWLRQLRDEAYVELRLDR